MSKKQGVIAAGHPETVQAGLEILRLGGNAFDAAVAAILASCVAEPGLTSLGGGGFLLAHPTNSQNILFDFFTQTPRYKRPVSEVNFYPVGVDFGTAIQEFHVGLGSMAVPGVLAGVMNVHQTLGKLPFSVVAQPAIELAKNGVELTSFQAYTLYTLLQPILLQTEEGKKIYTPGGKIPKLGERLVMKELAQTLEYLVEAGIREFYEGEIAQKIAQDCQEKGGYLTLEDFKNYRVIQRSPLQLNYRDKTILTNPPPSSGGILIAFSLKLLSQLDLTSVEFGSPQHLQILLEVMQLTNQARTERFDHHLYKSTIADEFLSLQGENSDEKKLINQLNKWGSTTHISVLDGDGNAASVTTSNGEGSGYMIPGTGIMLNNMLGEADLNPHGFHQWQEDVRISSMMSPTLVLNADQPEIILGSGGSNRIRTAILQVLINLIDFQMPLEQAVAHSRVHWENHRFDLEPEFAPTSIQNLNLSPASTWVQWPEKNMFFGGVHTIIRTANGEFDGFGDPRRSGVSLKI